MNAIMNWYAQLEKRERIIVSAGFVAVLLLLFYALIWSPVHGKAQRLERQVAAKHAELIRVDRLASQIAPASGAVSGSGNLLVDINSAIQRARLTAYAGATSVQTDKSVRVSFDNAPFDDIVKLLGELKTNRTVLIKSADFNEGDQAGTVNATLSLQAAG